MLRGRSPYNERVSGVCLASIGQELVSLPQEVRSCLSVEAVLPADALRFLEE